MKIIDLEQNTPEWHDWRGQGIGASESSPLFDDERLVECVRQDTNDLVVITVNGSPYSTPLKLFNLKTGREQAPDLSRNPHVQRGVRLEPAARDCANDYFGDFAIPMTAEHDDAPCVRASFDGVLGDGRVLEIKVPSESMYQRCIDQGPPAYYVAQLAQQMAVADAEVGYLFIYADDDNYLVFRFVRSGVMGELIEAVVPTVTAFWQNVLDDVAPDADPDRDRLDLEADSDFDKAAQEWIAAKEAEDEIKASMDTASKARKAAEKRLTELMGDRAKAEGGGVRVSRFEREGSVDYKKVITDLAPNLLEMELDGFRRASSKGVKVTLIK